MKCLRQLFESVFLSEICGRAARIGALALCALTLSACGDDPVEKAPTRERSENLIVLSLDTVRADVLGCYGFAKPTSPNLDRLAAEGIVFENAMTVAPWTLPAHGSLLTGLYPKKHGIKTVQYALNANVDTLASRLSAAGFNTAAVMNSPYLGRRYGFGRGFADFHIVAPDPDANNALQVVDTALDWLAAEERGPFFLFIHDYFSHSDYTAMPEHIERFTDDYDGYIDGTTKQLRAIARTKIPVDTAGRDHMFSLYLAGVRQTDESVGKLIQGLSRLELLDKTLMVVVSDHGEEFLEHGGVLHGRTQYREVMHIPLILRGPGLPAGRRIGETVSIIDVLPTVMSELGVPIGVGARDRLDGLDLSPLWSGGDVSLLSNRPLYGEADRDNARSDTIRSVWRGRHVLHYDRYAHRAELFDLSEDPSEQTDLYAILPEVASGLEADLRDFIGGSVSGRSLPPLSESEREQLRVLGYLVESNEPVSHSKKPAR